MFPRWTLSLVTGLVWLAAASAQTPVLKFQWKAGQVLTYRAQQVTTATEEIEGKKTQTAVRQNTTKRWQVLAVDQAGVATLQLSLLALRNEMTNPEGESFLYDSAAPDKSSPQLREQLAKYVGTPLQVIRVNSQGQVIEVKESKGPASRLENEPPFGIVLPAEALPAGSKGWQRTYKITLDPPEGKGEKFDAVQTYRIQGVEGGQGRASLCSIGLTTSLKSKPKAPADLVPLLPLQTAGDIVFNCTTGTVQSIRLEVDQEVKNHQDEGSSYHLRSTYTEQLAAE
jgi:hypothetical protein